MVKREGSWQLRRRMAAANNLARNGVLTTAISSGPLRYRGFALCASRRSRVNHHLQATILSGASAGPASSSSPLARVSVKTRRMQLRRVVARSDQHRVHSKKSQSASINRRELRRRRPPTATLCNSSSLIIDGWRV